MPRSNRYGLCNDRLLTTAAIAATMSACGSSDNRFDSPLDTVTSALTTYRVGPGKPYSKLQDIAGSLKPGDVVEVSGNQTYAGDLRFSAPGSASAKVTIRGVLVNGKRPVLSGGTNTVEFNADHYVFENFEVTGGSSRCVFHHAGDITIRNTIIHDCPSHGILGADSDAGSLTLEYSEVYKCGSADKRHPVYMATDESAYPHSVFRMQFCYLHDSNGGNSVKSRAERNEIYYNWIEGSYYRALELIGPDGQSENLAREDSDVVGNVLYQTRSYPAARLGGDGTGETWGRYRFVNNTIVMPSGSSSAGLQLFDGIESVEAHNNVFYRQGGGGVKVLDDGDASWAGSRVVAGKQNWVPSGSSSVPSEWGGTITGSNPGFVDAANRNFQLTSSSPLRDVGTGSPASPSGHAFPSPLTMPGYQPPLHAICAVGAGTQRPSVGVVDIGAYEQGTGSTPPAPTTTSTSNPPPAAPVSLVPSADTFVRAGSYAGSNFGTDAVLSAKTISTADLNRIGYVKFDISAVSSVSSAKIQFYAALSDLPAVATALYPVADTSWSETAMTWNNKPALGTASLGSVTVPSTSQARFELDVTSYVKSEQSLGHTRVAFAFQNPATSDPRVDVASRETGTTSPKLIVNP